MKTKIFMLLAGILLMCSCTNDNKQEDRSLNSGTNKVLLLKVDYTTNKFEGGKELTFGNQTDTFTVEPEYTSPGDFGSIKLHYTEVNQKIFDGTIIWMGLGAISYPENFLPANEFEVTLTNDYVFPSAGFENVFNPMGTEYDYPLIWNALQSLVKVRQYLASNPNAKVKLFLYTPSVGVGNPAEWDWIVMLKN